MTSKTGVERNQPEAYGRHWSRNGIKNQRKIIDGRVNKVASPMNSFKGMFYNLCPSDGTVDMLRLERSAYACWFKSSLGYHWRSPGKFSRVLVFALVKIIRRFY